MRVTDRITRAVRRERAVELTELLNRETGEPKTEGEIKEVLAAVESTLRSAAHLPAPRPTKEQIFGPVLTDSKVEEGLGLERHRMRVGRRAQVLDLERAEAQPIGLSSNHLNL